MRRQLVHSALGVTGVAQVELADDVVRMMHDVVDEVIGYKVQLARRELVVAVHRRRDRVRVSEADRVTDLRRSDVDDVVKDRLVFDGRHCYDDVVVVHRFTRVPLDNALVRTAHVYHLSCMQATNAINIMTLPSWLRQPDK